MRCALIIICELFLLMFQNNDFTSGTTKAQTSNAAMETDRFLHVLNKGIDASLFSALIKEARRQSYSQNFPRQPPETSEDHCENLSKDEDPQKTVDNINEFLLPHERASQDGSGFSRILGMMGDFSTPQEKSQTFPDIEDEEKFLYGDEDEEPTESPILSHSLPVVNIKPSQPEVGLFQELHSQISTQQLSQLQPENVGTLKNKHLESQTLGTWHPNKESPPSIIHLKETSPLRSHQPLNQSVLGHYQESTSNVSHHQENKRNSHSQETIKCSRTVTSPYTSVLPEESKDLSMVKPENVGDHNQETQEYEKIQNLLKTIGLDFGVSEISNLATRIRERLHGKKPQPTALRVYEKMKEKKAEVPTNWEKPRRPSETRSSEIEYNNSVSASSARRSSHNENISSSGLDYSAEKGCNIPVLGESATQPPPIPVASVAITSSSAQPVSSVSVTPSFPVEPYSQYVPMMPPSTFPMPSYEHYNSYMPYPPQSWSIYSTPPPLPPPPPPIQGSIPSIPQPSTFPVLSKKEEQSLKSCRPFLRVIETVPIENKAELKKEESSLVQVPIVESFQHRELLRKKRREKDGHKDPLLTEVSRLQEEVMQQISVIRKEHEEAEKKRAQLDKVAQILGLHISEKSKKVVKERENIPEKNREKSPSPEKSSYTCSGITTVTTTTITASSAGPASSNKVEFLVWGMSPFPFNVGIKTTFKTTFCQDKKCQDSATLSLLPRSLEQYEYYDAGNHWCKKLQHTIRIYFPLNPLTHTLWQKIFFCLGSEFLTSVIGFYCLLCEKFYGDQIAAEEHVSCHDHNEKYKKYIEENPLYEQRRNLDSFTKIGQYFKPLVQMKLKKKPEETVKPVTGVKMFGKFNWKKEQKEEEKKETPVEDIGDESKEKEDGKAQLGKAKPIAIRLSGKTIIPQTTAWTRNNSTPALSSQAKIRPNLPLPAMVLRKSSTAAVGKPAPLNAFLSIKSSGNSASKPLPVIKSESKKDIVLTPDLISKAFGGEEVVLKVPPGTEDQTQTPTETKLPQPPPPPPVLQVMSFESDVAAPGVVSVKESENQMEPKEIVNVGESCCADPVPFVSDVNAVESESSLPPLEDENLLCKPLITSADNPADENNASDFGNSEISISPVPEIKVDDIPFQSEVEESTLVLRHDVSLNSDIHMDEPDSLDSALQSNVFCDQETSDHFENDFMPSDGKAYTFNLEDNDQDQSACFKEISTVHESVDLEVSSDEPETIRLEMAEKEVSLVEQSSFEVLSLNLSSADLNLDTYDIGFETTNLSVSEATNESVPMETEKSNDETCGIPLDTAELNISEIVSEFVPVETENTRGKTCNEDFETADLNEIANELVPIESEERSKTCDTGFDNADLNVPSSENEPPTKEADLKNDEICGNIFKTENVNDSEMEKQPLLEEVLKANDSTGGPAD
uniref:C2H2-type domain-containing protein n=1 Tax=Erpetoichthys calabaricus TaxID=27687 RepID=A0A8C4SV17_ERPCA